MINKNLDFKKFLVLASKIPGYAIVNDYNIFHPKKEDVYAGMLASKVPTFKMYNLAQIFFDLPRYTEDRRGELEGKCFIRYIYIECHEVYEYFWNMSLK